MAIASCDGMDNSLVSNFYSIVTIVISGFSDPYCMLGIMPARRVESMDGTEGGSLGSSDEENSGRYKEKRGLRKFSLRKKSAALRDLLPAKYIQTTRVIPNTLNPVWNDKFRL